MVYIWEMAAIAGGAGGEKLSESGTQLRLWMET